MTKAIHLINRREGVNLLGLTPWPGQPDGWRSCCWRITDEQAADLVGGWVYLHEAKSASSRFGGRILGFEPGDGDMAARKKILFQADPKGRQQKWRGVNQGMAMSGGIVDATLEHETQ